MNPPRCAVFGHPIGHSFSPLLHQLFAQQAGITLQYDKFDVVPEQFEQSVEDFFEEGGKGLNITLPFKLRAFELARNRLSERAKAAQSVNTLWFENSTICGCNTDGLGLVNDIQRLDFELTNKRVLLIGAGGAARGALLPLLQAGCQQLHIANRTQATAYALCEQAQGLRQSPMQIVSASGLDAIPPGWDIIINASASSLSQTALPLNSSHFSAYSLAYDMLYQANSKTTFLQQARTLGARQTHDGLGMLVYQGLESFKIWFGIELDGVPVLQELRRHLLSNT